MIPRGLIVAVTVGIAAAAVFGLVFVSYVETEQLVFVEGPSVSIVTEKTDFAQGEEIRIRIVNSGTVPLTFPDLRAGFSVRQLDGILVWSDIPALQIVDLAPGQEQLVIWNQQKNNGEFASPGLYKLDVDHFSAKKSITINILPRDDIVKGKSISIVTEKDNFDLGESVSVRVINTGTVAVSHPNTSWGFHVGRIDGDESSCYGVPGDEMMILHPGREITLGWDQTDSCGDPVLPGVYEIHVLGHGGKFITVGISPNDGPSAPALAGKASLSLALKTIDFKHDEPVQIRVTNTGTVPLTFPTTDLGFVVTRLDGDRVYPAFLSGPEYYEELDYSALIYPSYSNEEITLEPRDTITSIWNLTSMSQNSSYPETFTFNIEHPYAEKSITLSVPSNETATPIFEESSLLIVAEKITFKQGDKIWVRIVNSGTVPLTFPDTGIGFGVTQLDGSPLYYPPFEKEKVTLEPEEKMIFMWNQTFGLNHVFDLDTIDVDGTRVSPGTYKLHVRHQQAGESVTINILSRADVVEKEPILIVTEKDTFEIAEPVSVRVINSAQTSVSYPYTTWGFYVSRVDGVEASCEVIIRPEEVVLHSKREKTFFWDQTDSCGDQVLPGIYEIHAMGYGGKLITIAEPSVGSAKNASLSILTDKTDFVQSEEINIRVTNTGTVPLSFLDKGLRYNVMHLNGTIILTNFAFHLPVTLGPGKEITFAWDQTVHDFDVLSPGTYKIGLDSPHAENPFTINILPHDGAVDGKSISIITEKDTFELGEWVSVRVVNSGTVNVWYPDTSWGFHVVRVDGNTPFCTMAANDMVVHLRPGHEETFVWHQKNNCGDLATPGIYKIGVLDHAEKLITILEPSVGHAKNASLSIVLDKTDFLQSDQINIRVVNSGTVPLTFPDARVGLVVTGSDGVGFYSYVSYSETILEPGDEATFVWHQVLPPGTYKIALRSPHAESPVTINIMAHDGAVEGKSLLIVTEKDTFELGEPVNVTVTNTGTVTASHPDTSWGFYVGRVDGDQASCYGMAGTAQMNLNPGRTTGFVWHQTDSCGDPVLPGVYEIHVLGYSGKFITIVGPSNGSSVEKTSLSILTDKTDFLQSDDINIRVVNSGTVPLSFPDKGLRFNVMYLNGTTILSDPAIHSAITLEPGDETTFVWDQDVFLYGIISPGTYKIALDSPHAESPVRINILAHDGAVEGPSISIVTEKDSFELGERVRIRVINTGTVTASHPDISWGFYVSDVNGTVVSCPLGHGLAVMTLNPGRENTFVWDQTNCNNSRAPPGVYEIHALNHGGKFITVGVPSNP